MYLTFASSAPGDLPLSPLPGGARGVVSESEPDVTSTVVQDQGGSGSNHLSVSDGRTLVVIE